MIHQEMVCSMSVLSLQRQIPALGLSRAGSLQAIMNPGFAVCNDSTHDKARNCSSFYLLGVWVNYSAWLLYNAITWIINYSGIYNSRG